MGIFGGFCNTIIGWCGGLSDFFENRGCNRLSRLWYKVYDKVDDMHYNWVMRRY
jgi:hypothetical protein